MNARLQGSGERNCRVPLRIPKFPHPLSYGGHHSNICVHHCFHVNGPQLLRPTGDPSHPVWLHIKSQSHSKISEPLWALELIPGEIIKVTWTWVACGITICHKLFYSSRVTVLSEVSWLHLSRSVSGICSIQFICWSVITMIYHSWSALLKIILKSCNINSPSLFVFMLALVLYISIQILELARMLISTKNMLGLWFVLILQFNLGRLASWWFWQYWIFHSMTSTFLYLFRSYLISLSNVFTF